MGYRIWGIGYGVSDMGYRIWDIGDEAMRREGEEARRREAGNNI